MVDFEMGFGVAQRLRQQRLGPAEDVREVWATLAGALGELAQQAEREQWSPVRSTPHSASLGEGGAEGGGRRSADGLLSSSPAASDQDGGTSHVRQLECHEGRLEAICAVTLEWGRSLVGSDLEGLQLLLMRLSAARQRWRRFASRLDQLVAQLQQEAQAQYGAPLAMRVSRLL